ncbi:MAG: tetratricopeptide repeat protein [Verrucomicrobiia bacterium]|jgi:tetratricopeptide (TPR) repeat protein
MAASAMKNEWRVLAAVCVLVVGVYVCAAYSGFMARPRQQAADAFHNQLVEGFQAGQLNLKVDVPAGLTQLADPYDPTANAPYRTAKYGLYDLSYYKGKVYLYFGVTPALLLFWPFVALTGHYLYDGQAVVIFCALGFLGSVAMLCALRRRYFSDVSVWVVAAGALALGLATGVPMLLPRSAGNEVAISCAYMLTMLALGAIYCALHQPDRRWLWLAAASVVYGLALGARPTLVFGAMILLAPVVQEWRERRTVWPLLMAAVVPITLIGFGLMLYNARRFDSPFEFGIHYQLLSGRQTTQQFFSLRYLWFNFRVYFLEPVRWGRHFPFVRDITAPRLPAGHGAMDYPFGILCDIPVVWLALALPLAWRGRTRESRSPLLQGFIAVATLFWGVCALIVDLYYYTGNRFETEILPTLVLLAVIGILGLERALADQPDWRRAARWGWGLLLGFSVAFNLLVSVERCADVYVYAGASMQELGKMREAIKLFQQALRIDPDHADAHFNLGTVFLQQGKVSDAIEHYEQALRIKPDFAGAHNDLGVALEQAGKCEDAIGHYEQALRIQPDLADAHNNLGIALAQTGNIKEAIAQYGQALRINPDYPQAHVDLGNLLLQEGKVSDAIGHYEQALRIKPDYDKAHYNLGVALEKAGRAPEAIQHYEQALRLRPDLTAARNALARLQNSQ